jgi:hypothetical protein
MLVGFPFQKMPSAATAAAAAAAAAGKTPVSVLQELLSRYGLFRCRVPYINRHFDTV